MAKIIGIDFGTTKSIASIMGDGVPVIIPDAQDHQYLPSLVLVAPDEKLYVGWDALTHPARYQSQHFTISSIKRLMGKAGVSSWGNLQTYPQEISALILGCLKAQAEAYLEEEITRAVIAVPAHFDINQRQATKDAARIAGLGPERLLDEATAAALAYGFDKKKAEFLVVFDFGGGTLDISIVETGDGVVEVKTAKGDDHLSGDDFDQTIIDFLIDKASHDFGPSIELSPMHRLVLREAAIQAKKELSYKLDTRIYIPAFLSAAGRHFNLDVALDRSTFEGLCLPLFERAKNLLKESLADARLKPSDLGGLLLVGGTSLIPRVRAIASDVTSLQPSFGFDPTLIVAQGAAIKAGILSGDIHDILLLNATYSTFSLASPGADQVIPMVARNTCIPTKKSETFTTTKDNQTEMTFQVFQGEHSLVSQNTLIGEVRLSGLFPAMAGTSKIEVVFDIDPAGMLFVSASDPVTKKNVATLMQAPYRLNDAQFNVLRRKVEKELIPVRKAFHTAAYKEKREEHEHSKAIALINEIARFLSANRTALNPEHARLLVTGQDLLKDNLAKEVGRAELNKLITSVRRTYVDASRSLEKR